jgi:predicted 3-demethylubiquinone-9 3-methyltransferase (glyoxalase superfamily)
MGIPCLGLSAGSGFKHSEAFSFQVATDDQAETPHGVWALADATSGCVPGQIGCWPF